MKDVSDIITYLTPCLKHVFLKKTKQEKKLKKKEENKIREWKDKRVKKSEPK